MSQNIPICCSHHTPVVHVELPTEDKIRTPALFEHEINRYGGLCKDALDELKIIEECQKKCAEMVAEAKNKIIELEEETADLEMQIQDERQKENPDKNFIKARLEEIANKEKSRDEVLKEKIAWEETQNYLEKLKGEWNIELPIRRNQLELLLREWQKGAPWKCGAPTKYKPPTPCKNTGNYIEGKWGHGLCHPLSPAIDEPV